MISLQDIRKGLYLYLLCCVIIAVYSLTIYIISHGFMKDKAQGSLIYDNEGNIRGSVLLAQDFQNKQYFKGRNNFTISQNICDVAMYSKIFRREINSRYTDLFYKDDVIMITSSSSLLDPYISKKEALRQAEAVADARGVDLVEIVNLIEELTLHSLYPFFQLDIVNVTKLNAWLDYRFNSHL